MELRENGITFPRVLGEELLVEPVPDLRMHWSSAVFGLVQKLMQSGEIMRLYRFGATSSGDSRLTETLSRVLVAFLVHRSADVATALCATDISLSLIASRVERFGRTTIVPRRTCTPEQAVLVQTVKSLGTLVAPS